MRYLKQFENNNISSSADIIKFHEEVDSKYYKILSFLSDEGIESSNEGIVDYNDSFIFSISEHYNDAGIGINIVTQDSVGNLIPDFVSISEEQCKLLVPYFNGDMEQYRLLKNSNKYNL